MKTYQQRKHSWLEFIKNTVQKAHNLLSLFLLRIMPHKNSSGLTFNLGVYNLLCIQRSFFYCVFWCTFFAVLYLVIEQRGLTSRRQWGRLPPCPLVIGSVPLKCPSRNLHFPHRVPLPRRQRLGALALSTTKYSGLNRVCRKSLPVLVINCNNLKTCLVIDCSRKQLLA